MCKIKLAKTGPCFLIIPIVPNSVIHDMEYQNRKQFTEEESLLIQTDWDYPPTASTFGWTPCPECSNTDGTIDCEHKTASQMISEAHDYLCENIGKVTLDPGYYEYF
jgi:hypothetical protein